MKKTFLLLIPALLFSILFYGNRLGLNMFLFAITALITMTMADPARFKKIETKLLSLTYLLTSVAFFINTSALTFFSNFISFFVLLGAYSHSGSSLYITFFNGLFSAVASFFYRQYSGMETASTKENRKIDYVFWSKIIGIPLIAITVFVILYRSANPYFDGLIQEIDLSFINLQWLLFTLMGYFLFLNITHPVAIEPITVADNNTVNTLNAAALKKQDIHQLIQENQLGIVLILALTILIVFYLVTDLLFLNDLADLTAPGLSKAVHEGVSALITSILIAIIIILYFFRGNLNFFKKNELLKNVIYGWIGGNIILIFTTVYKNYLYITYYGLTYKRIGVYVYLFLALSGLVTTFIKINHKYNIWYLLRRNSAVAYILLIVTGFVNWDSLITNYNITTARVTDLPYLLRLHNNAQQLKIYQENNHNLSLENSQKIISKYTTYYTDLTNRKWQEWIWQNIDNLK